MGLNCVVPLMWIFFFPPTQYILQCCMICGWLNPRMWNCGYGEMTVEFYADFWLHRVSAPYIVQGSTVFQYDYHWSISEHFCIMSHNYNFFFFFWLGEHLKASFWATLKYITVLLTVVSILCIGFPELTPLLVVNLYGLIFPQFCFPHPPPAPGNHKFSFFRVHV